MKKKIIIIFVLAAIVSLGLLAFRYDKALGQYSGSSVCAPDPSLSPANCVVSGNTVKYCYEYSPRGGYIGGHYIQYDFNIRCEPVGCINGYIFKNGTCVAPNERVGGGAPPPPTDAQLAGNPTLSSTPIGIAPLNGNLHASFSNSNYAGEKYFHFYCDKNSSEAGVIDTANSYADFTGCTYSSEQTYTPMVKVAFPDGSSSNPAYSITKVNEFNITANGKTYNWSNVPNPLSVNLGSSATLGYKLDSDQTSCGAVSSPNDSNWSGNLALDNSAHSATVSPKSNTAYGLSCTDGGNSFTNLPPYNVSVSSPPPPPPNPNPNPNNNPPPPPKQNNNPPPPPQGGQILTFQSNPSIINKGQSSYLSWSTSGFTSCSLTGNPPPPSNASVPTNDSKYPITPASSTIYTLTCNPGNVSQSVQVKVGTLKEILPPQ